MTTGNTLGEATPTPHHAQTTAIASAPTLAGLIAEHPAIAIAGITENGYILNGSRDELRRFEAMAHDVALSLSVRLADVGNLIALIDHHDKGVDPETTEGVGFLVADLAKVVHALTAAGGTARSGLQTLERAEATAAAVLRTAKRPARQSRGKEGGHA